MNPLLPELDHVMLAVHDHAQAIATWQRLGFTVRPVRQLVPMGGGAAGGNGGSAAVLLHSATPGCANFIELARADPATAAPAMKTLLCGPEGVALLVHATSDPAALQREWTARGWACQSIHLKLAPIAGGEPATVDVVLPQPGCTPLAFNAMKMSSTADFERDEWRSHANTARRWCGVSYVETASNWSRTRELLRSLYSGEGLDVSEGVWTIRPATVTLTLMTDTAFAAHFGAAAGLPAGARPRGVLLAFEVDELDKARDHLTAQRVAFEARNDSLLVPAEAALGVVVQLHRRGGVLQR